MKYRSLIWVALLMVMDLVTIVAADIGAYFIYTDFVTVLIESRAAMMQFIPLQMVTALVVYNLMRMYHYLWRSLSLRDVLNMVCSVLLAYLAASLLTPVFGISIANTAPITFINKQK